MTAELPVRRNEIRIDSARAIRLIANSLEEHRAETLAAVHVLDSHVSDDYTGERLEQRIEEALKAATPWQFIFILTGGWRRVRQHLVSARAEHRADLLLLAIAMRQLTSLDGPAEPTILSKAAQILGFDREWVTDSLEALERLRLITGTHQPKCPHLRYAEVVVKGVLDDRSDPLRVSIFSLLNAALSEADISLRGMYWLIEPLRFSDGLWGQRDTVLSVSTRRAIFGRCFAAATPIDRGMAAYVLSQMDDFTPDWSRVLQKHVPVISKWVAEATGVSGWGLARFLNAIDREHHEINNGALAAIDTDALAARFSTIPLDELGGFAAFLERLAYVGRDAFMGLLRAKFAPDAVRAIASDASRNTFAFGKVVEAIASYDQELALQLVDDNTAALAETFAKDPLEAFEDLDRVIWFVLSFDMGLGIVSKPKPAQRAIGKRLCAKLDPDACARLIEAGLLRDLERWGRLLFFVMRADPRRARLIVSELKLEKLDAWLSPYWAKPPIELEHFTMTLAFRPEFEPARSWIT